MFKNLVFVHWFWYPVGIGPGEGSLLPILMPPLHLEILF